MRRFGEKIIRAITGSIYKCGFVFLLSVGLLLVAFSVRAAELEMDAAYDLVVVSLRINGVEEDPFYEVVLQEQEILVSLTDLALRSGIAVTWKHREGIASFVRPTDGKVVVIAIGQRIMRIGGDIPVEIKSAPLVYNGLPYVPLDVIQEVLGYLAEWDYDVQVLTLTIQKQNMAGSGELPAAEGKSSVLQPGHDIYGPLHFDFSLNATQNQYHWKLGLTGPFSTANLPLQWHLGVGGNQSPASHFQLQDLAIEYQGSFFDLILGDAAVFFPGYVAGRPVRGLTFGLPEVPLKPYSLYKHQWNGEAPLDSIVELYIDGLLYSKQTAAAGRFNFDEIPINSFGITKLEVKILKPDGSVETMAREATATPFSQPYGSGIITAAFGQRAEKAWFVPEERYFFGIDWSQGFLPWLTTRAVFVREAPFQIRAGEAVVASNSLILGSIMNLSDQIGLLSDFMLSGYWVPSSMATQVNDIAARTTLRWTGENSGVQGTLYYYGPGYYLPGALHPESNYGGTMSGTWRLSSANTLNLWYDVQHPAELPLNQPGWHHQCSLRYSQYFKNSLSLAAGTRVEYDPLDEDLWSGVFSLNGRYSANGQATLSAGGILSWTWNSTEGTSLTYSSEAALSARISAKSNLDLKLFGNGDNVNAIITRYGGILQYQHALTDVHKLAFTSTYMQPDFNYQFSHDEHSALTADLTWSGAASTEAKTQFSAGITAVWLIGNNDNLIFPVLKLEAFQRGSGTVSKIGWRAALEYTARADAPAVVLTVRIDSASIVTPGGIASVPQNDDTCANMVGGVVFRDDNNNGVQDRGEPGIPDLLVTLGNNKTYTDRHGVFVFTGLKTGIYDLELPERSLPIEYASADGPWTALLGENTRYWYEIPLTLWGTLSGYVYIDMNNNNIFDAGDQPLPGVHILLNGTATGVYTDAQGYYYIEDLSAGSYLLSLDDDTLPEGVTPLADTEGEGTAGSGLIINAEITEAFPDLSECDFAF